MNALTKALLAGAAIGALVTGPATAGDTPGFHFTALHGGRVVNKTKMHNHGATHVTYTFGVYAYVPSSTPVHTKLTLLSETFCASSIKANKPFKTPYGKVSVNVETYSTGCANITTTYKVLQPLPQGGTDTFETSVSGKYQNNGAKYKGTINLDFSVEFE